MPEPEITVFLGGHGRCAENVQVKSLPANVQIYWYGQLGNPVTKAYSSAVLHGDHKVMSGMSSAQHLPCRHWLCDTLSEELRLRAEQFHSGGWNSNAYLLQPKQDNDIPLFTLARFLGKKFSGKVVALRWSVCRSSTLHSGLWKHDFTNGQATLVQRDDTSPSKPAKQMAIVDLDGAVFLEQWGKPIGNYGGATRQQLKNVGAMQAMKKPLPGQKFASQDF
ncbi:MAG: hypothetical protein ACREFO_02405 [Acetobacteraceae bacterium]